MSGTLLCAEPGQLLSSFASSKQLAQESCSHGIAVDQATLTVPLLFPPACAGQDISLSGTRCLEAAIHCAAIHCAQQKDLGGATSGAAAAAAATRVSPKVLQQQHMQQTHQHEWQLHYQDPGLVPVETAQLQQHIVEVSLPPGRSKGFVAVLQRLKGMTKLALMKK
jgi:hypothetical protein